MDAVARKAIEQTHRSALLGVADPLVGQRLVREIERFTKAGAVYIASSAADLRELAKRVAPDAILLDFELLRDLPPSDLRRTALAELVHEFTASAPVVLLAPPECQSDVAGLVAEGNMEFVARVGDFVPLAASLIERRLRWAEMSESSFAPPWSELQGDLGEIFRHEVNNPLTGILGNAELLLSHRERLSAVDTQRLQTVVDLAVRLRETIRRLSNTAEPRRVRATPPGHPVGDSVVLGAGSGMLESSALRATHPRKDVSIRERLDRLFPTS